MKVHYNSDKPAQVQAHAYAQGTNIHIAPGEEKQLPHELWHVVQQKQGRVKPTRQVKSKVGINDDVSLEEEADVMGQKALTAGRKVATRESIELLQQKGKAGNMEPTVAPILKPRTETPGRNAVQRRIQLDGVNADLSHLLKQANDMKERVILANWDWSDTEHNFKKSKKLSARQKLKAAVKSAKSQVVDVPALYNASNLKFLTKASGRLPTLYFESGSESGRIRQQHGSGPKVVGQTNKTDYFFSDEDGLNRFEAAARQARKNRIAFNPNLPGYNATLTPTADYFHYEVTYASGQKIAKLHRSGGKVDPEISGYDNTRIKSIYQGVIGYST